MRYELLLHTGDPAVPLELSKVDAALDARGAPPAVNGARIWKLKTGEVELRPLSEGGVPKAVELRIGLSDKLDLVRELVVEGAALAQEAGVRLYDPQLSRTLTAADEGLVADQYLRTARYAGEMMGVSAAIGASFQPPQEGLKPGTKVLLGIIGLLVLAWLLMDSLFSARPS